MNDLDASAIRGHLGRILASGGFGRLGPLLQSLVEKALAGESLDPISGEDANKLRALLTDFARANPNDPIVISLRNGIPVFERVQKPRRTAEEPPMRFHMSGPAIVFIMVTIMSFGIGLFLYLGSKAKKQPKPAIAVLPFRNLSAQREHQYLSDGLTIELIESLTRIENLGVVSWNSAARYGGKAGSLGELRSGLNAAAVIDGSVQKLGEKIRVTAQLVDTARGNSIWSQNWETELKDIPRIQEEIAKSVVYGLRVQMSADPDELFRRRTHAARSEVYDDYLRARFHQVSNEGLRLSREYARKAIEKDPEFAPPYALLASTSEVMSQVKQLAAKAITLDPQSGEAHVAMGTALARGEWKFQEARRFFLKAIELNPGSAKARSAYALGYLLPNGNLIEAEFEAKRSVELDPLSFLSNYSAGYVLQQFPGKEAEAIRYYDKAIEIDSNSGDAIWNRGFAQAFLGGGEKQKAREMISKEESATHLDRARGQALIGDIDAALTNLERAYAERDPQVMYLKVDRLLSNLRGESRFQILVRKAGL